MSLLSQLDSVGEGDKSRAVKKLITESTPDFNFFLLVVLSVLMATFGLLVNNSSIVIGSMLIAPILSPILGISLGLVMSDGKLLWRSIYTVFKASMLGIASAVIVTLLFGDFLTPELNAEIQSRTEPSVIYFFIALISGFAVSYTLVKPDLSETLPGIAVAVALIPPLAVVGVGFAKLDMSVAFGALALYAINIFGIALASLISFSLMNLYDKRKVAANAIHKEERRLEKEIKQEEKFREKISHLKEEQRLEKETK